MNASVKTNNIDAVTIAAYKIPPLEELFKRFSKTAAKLNLPQPIFAATKAADRIETNDFGIEHIISQVSVSFSLPVLKLNGWQLVGCKEIGEGAALAVVRCVPGRGAEARFWSTDDTCEHCRKVRSRKSLYVLQDASGKQIQVGSGCLADFLGHHEAEKIAALLSDMLAVVDGVEEDDYDSFGGERRGLCCTFGTALRTAIRMIDIKGFSPASNMSDSTKSLMMTAIFGKHKDQEAAWKEMRKAKLTDDQVEDRAIAVSCWALDLKGDTEIDRNMKALAGQSGVKSKDFGFVAAMVPTFDRANIAAEKVVEKQKDSALLPAFTVQPGERVTVHVVVEREATATSYWGTSFIYTMVGIGEDENKGRTFVWFSSSGILRLGDDLTICGRFKEETEYKGSKQVRLTHVKIVPTR